MFEDALRGVKSGIKNRAARLKLYFLNVHLVLIAAHPYKHEISPLHKASKLRFLQDLRKPLLYFESLSNCCHGKVNFNDWYSHQVAQRGTGIAAEACFLYVC